MLGWEIVQHPVRAKVVCWCALCCLPQSHRYFGVAVALLKKIQGFRAGEGSPKTNKNNKTMFERLT